MEEPFRYWELLVLDMLATGEFFPDRLKHVHVRQTHYARRSVVLPRTVNFVPRERMFAHIARMKTKNPHCQEIAWAYVHPGKEGNGVLKAIAIELFASIPRGLRLFGFSRKTPVKRVFLQHGLTPVTRAMLEALDIRSTKELAAFLGIEERRLKGIDLENESIEGERQLFIRL